MAVVQISRIQLRRGRKNSVSGVPQLASAEMAWAVDSQELYIGNGAVSEGSPYVGNTRILTEHENLLDLISSYQYAAADLTLSASTVPRSLQNKLDETVSVADFGGTPVAEDIAAAFNLAMVELFSNSDSTEQKKVLMVPNGSYELEADLVIPSGTILRGETETGTVIDIGSYNIVFVSEDGTTFDNITSSDFPQDVTISNLTIQRTTGQLVLSGLKNSTFNDINVRGAYTLNTSLANPSAEAPAIFIENVSSETVASDITFNRCVFANNSIGVGASNAVANTSSIKFNDCHFLENYFGNYINGQAGQRTWWAYKGCTFERIFSSAFISTAGVGTVIRNCTFVNVGNALGLANAPQFPMVQFGQVAGNVVLECYSDRAQLAAITENSSVLAYPEVVNADKVTFLNRLNTTVGLTDSLIPFAVLSTEANTYTIDYVLRLGPLYRKGTLTIALGNKIAPTNEDISIIDDAVSSPNISISAEGLIISNFLFSVSLHDNNFDGNNDTIALLYRNDLVHQGGDSTTAMGLTGDISFEVTYYN